ncbi:MAG: CinA family nicotinamide mononucleotide deamidase-related protein [Anaerolineales bacterium]
MPSAEIITIGTELLLGEILDSNSQYLARCLRETGIDLFRKTTVGDNVNRIAQAIQQSLERCDIVITSGGLGPTIDDPTRQAVSQAIDSKLEFHPELWEQIIARFQRMGRIPTENNRRQAYIPSGALAFENPVGTAPIFILEYKSHIIISLPGVPRELEYLMTHTVIPYLRQYYDLHGVIKSRILHTVGVGESQIDDLIADLEELSNPTVGLAAHSGQVDVRITVKADSEEETQRMIQPLEDTLHSRLGDWIYGVDQETLEEVALRSIAGKKWTLTVIEAGMGGILIRRLAAVKGPFVGGQVMTDPPSLDELVKLTDSYQKAQNADVALGVSLMPSTQTHDVIIVVMTPHGTKKYQRVYGGVPEYAPFWAYNQSLDLIRRITNET